MFVYEPFFVPFQSSIMNRFLRVRPSQKLAYENIPVQTKIINERSRMKFYLKHHWGGGNASVGLDLDLIRTLVSMDTFSSHIVTVGKTASSYYAPNFEKVGDILVSACPCVCMYSCSRYHLETSCMDSS